MHLFDDPSNENDVRHNALCGAEPGPPENQNKSQKISSFSGGDKASPSLFEEEPALFDDVPDLFGGQAEQEEEPDLWQQMGESRTPKQQKPDVWQMLDEEDAGRPRDLRQQQAEPPVPPRSGQGENKKTPKPKRKKAGKKMRLRWKIFIGAAGVVTALFLWLVISVLHSTRNDELWLDLDQIPYRTETILYYTDRDSGELLEYTRLPCTQNKIYTDPAEIPEPLKQAFVAVEDQDFYDHGGYSIKRTAYALLNELKHAVTGSYIGDGIKQGASTINQQLVKNLTADDESSGGAGYMRKLREIYRAARLDDAYDKDTILCAYLNTISFTGNTAGVGAEAQKLFGKEVRELTLAECASLAAITRNPSRYSPVTNPENHIERRNYVLSLMRDQGYISQQECAEAQAEELHLNYQGEPAYVHTITSYFTDAVIEAVIQGFVHDKGLSRAEASNLIYNGGLRITTTVDPVLQGAMEQILQDTGIYPQLGQTVKKTLTDDDGKTLLDEDGNAVYGDVTVYPQAAMVSLDYEGGIVALVGGFGEKEISRGFNRATSAVRQVGSTMKPIGPYAVALDRGQIHWSSSFLDAPLKEIEDPETGKMQEWPANATRRYTNKEVLVHHALAESINTVAVRVGEEAGVNRMYTFVKDTLGVSTITGDDKDLGPLVLGSSTYGITPLDMAKAYAMFGNGGVVNEPYCFTSVESGAGRVYLTPAYKSTQAIDAATATVMNRLLEGVMQSGGTAAGMQVPGSMDSVGKTGTTSDHRDHWFVGLTPYYVTASWYGYDENLALGVSSHWNPPILAWRSVMQKAQQGLPEKEFVYDTSVVQQSYCTQSGYLAGSACPSATGWYKKNAQPRKGCPLHGG